MSENAQFEVAWRSYRCTHSPPSPWWFYNIENWLITWLSALYDEFGV